MTRPRAGATRPTFQRRHDDHYGRAICIRDHHPPVLYIVAIEDAAEAIALIREKVGAPGDVIEDVARVSGALLQSLKLQPGEYIRA